MGKEYPEIDPAIRDWIAQQKMFFVSTAPLAQDGLINCSPKGMDTLRVLGPRTIGYLDMTGSGVETIAHLKGNKRIVIMMCAFDGPPKIFRFYGKGEVLEIGTEKFNELVPQFEKGIGARSIIRIEIDLIRDSCGYAIPLLDYTGERDVLSKWAESKGLEGVRKYREENNQVSLDGLEGLTPQ